MSAIDQLLDNNRRYAASSGGADPGPRPATRVAVLTCMDARIDVHRMLGVGPGDVHAVRNAGGVVTDDAVRSLMLSGRLLGTEEVMVIHHTGCGMLGLDASRLEAEIERETGVRPGFDLGAFSDLEEDVRRCVAALRDNPMVPQRSVRGFVYEVSTGALREIPC